MRRFGFVRHACLATLGTLLVGTAVLVGVARPAFAVAPTVTAISPAFGSWQGGTSVTVTGTGFTTTADTTVNFGSLPGTNVNVLSATSLTVLSPDAGVAAAGTSVPVTVTNSGGTSNATVMFTYSNCTFNGSAAGGIIQVTPGNAIAISCTHVASGIASFVIALASPVAGFATPFSIASEESLIMNNSPALPPAATSDASGNLTVSLPVPTKQTGGNPGSTATDGDATCPPTQAEVDQGLLTCAVAVANLSGVNFGASLLEYPGQPSPHPPTLTLTAQSSTVAAGTTITATGTGWWGAGPGSNSIPPANVKVGGVAATTAALSVRSPVYSISCTSTTCSGTLTAATLTGTFVIPPGAPLTTVTIDQPNTSATPCSAPANCFPGNGPGNTVEGTAPLVIPQATASVTTWNGNVPNSALINDTNPPNQNLFWQPPATTAPVSYQVSLGTATTLSAATTAWFRGFTPPSAYTIDTSPDGVTFTTQVSVTGNTAGARTDLFPGGQVTASFIRITITAFGPTCTGCGYAALALVQFGWDGHATVFPQATASGTGVSTWNGNVPSFPLTNGGNPNVFWQPVAAAAAPVTYETDLGAPTTLSSVTPVWHSALAPPSAFTIDTSPDGKTFTTQVPVTGNTSNSNTYEFPEGQVTASYLRLTINAFPAPCAGCGFAELALVKLSWNGAAPVGRARAVNDGATTAANPTVTSATANFTGADLGEPISGGNASATDIPANAYIGVINSPTSIGLSSSPTSNVPLNATATGSGVTLVMASVPTTTPPTCSSAAPCGSSLFPQAYYPATLPNSTTANTTTTWQSRVTNNIFNGGSYGCSTTGTPACPNISEGSSWWQPANTGTTLTGNIVLAVDLGSARTIATVKATWLNATSCPGHGTCTGFNPVNYQILSSPNGTQNSWTVCATVTANTSFTTTDACAASSVQYVEYFITSWNSTTPVQPNDGYGPAASSLAIT